MRKMIWLHTPTLFWLGGGIISISSWMCMGLKMLGRQKYTQQNHSCLSWVPLRLRWQLKIQKDTYHHVLIKSQQNWLNQGVELFALRSTNLSILFGIGRESPEEWKESIVIPIYKKGDKTDCINYRGISVCQLHTKFYPTSCCQG